MTQQLTTAEAAARLGLSPQQVRLLCRLGRIRARRHGRDWLLDAAAVEAARKRPKVGRPKTKTKGST